MSPDEAKRPPGRPRNLPIDEQRAVILAAACAEFGEHGHRGATIERIARGAGVSRASVYELFDGKDDLWVAVVDDAVERVFTWMGERIGQAAGLSMRDRFRLVVSSLFEFIDAHPDAAAVIRQAQRGRDGSSAVEVTGRQRVEDGLAALMQAGWEPFGGIPPEAARVLAVSAIATVETIGFRAAGEPGWPPEATVNLLSEMLMGGHLRLGRHREVFDRFET